MGSARCVAALLCALAATTGAGVAAGVESAAVTPAGVAPGAGATPAGTSSPMTPIDCSLIDNATAARLLDYPVEDPDELSRSGGICFFVSRDVSQDGSVSYAVVTAASLPQRRAFFTAMARRCAGVVAQAPRAGLCATYINLAQVKDLDAYFMARTAFPDAMPVAGLGDAAIASSDTLFVRRGGTIFEMAVRRNQTLDLAASKELALLLLQRVAR